MAPWEEDHLHVAVNGVEKLDFVLMGSQKVSHVGRLWVIEGFFTHVSTRAGIRGGAPCAPEVAKVTVCICSNSTHGSGLSIVWARVWFSCLPP